MGSDTCTSVMMEFLRDLKRKDLLPIKIMFASLMTGVYSLYPYLTLQLGSQGVTASETALIYSIIPIFTFLAPPIVGFCVDKFGHIKIVYCVICLLCAIFADSLMFIPDAVVRTNYTNQISWQLSCSSYQLQLQGRITNLPTQCNLIDWNQTMTANVSVTVNECNRVCTNGNVLPALPCLRGHPNWCYSPNLYPWTLVGMRFKGVSIDDNITNGIEFGVDNLIVEGKLYDGLMCDIPAVHCWTYCSGHMPALKLCHPKEEYNPMTFWINLIIRILQAIVSTSAFVLFEAMTLEMLKKRNADYGHQKLWGHIVACIITPITGLLIDYASVGKLQTDYSVAFYIYTISRLMSFIIMPFLAVDFKMPEQTHFKDVIKLAKDKEFAVFIGIIFVTGAFWGYLEGFIFLFLKELNSPQVVMGLTVTAGAVAGLPMLLCSGIIIKKLGHVNVLALALFVYTIRFIGYSLIWNPYLCLLFESLETVTSVLHLVAAATYTQKLAPPAILASAQGIFAGVHFGIGRGAGSLVGGYLMGYLGSRASFQILGGVSGILTVVYLVAYHLWLKKELQMPTTNSDEITDNNSINVNGNCQHECPKRCMDISHRIQENIPPTIYEGDKPTNNKTNDENLVVFVRGKYNIGFEDDESKTKV